MEVIDDGAGAAFHKRSSLVAGVAGAQRLSLSWKRSAAAAIRDSMPSPIGTAAVRAKTRRTQLPHGS